MAWAWLLFVSLVVLAIFKYKTSSKKHPPLPPGPPADPLIGHIRLFPSNSQDMFFYELGLKYGDVVHLNIIGQSMVVLNSVQAANELLDKRGAIYSDRPILPSMELLGMGGTLPFLGYGTEWRKQRTLLHQWLNMEKSKEYLPIQAREARILARNLSTSTGDRLKIFLHFMASVITEVNYGHQLESRNDPYLKIVDDCSIGMAESGPPGGTPVNMFPLLRKFPSWFPGTYYATRARNASPKFRMLFEYPYNQLKEQMIKGAVKPSFLSSALEDLHRAGAEKEEDVKRIQAVSATFYLAGAETTSSALSFFLLAMVHHPEIQIKAQEEIDRVIGTDRLPEFEDRDSLPYVECITQETMRWYQPAPSGVPHKSTEDDIYNGMFIPKGSIVIANTRGMTLNGAVYKEPFKFDPSRFLPSPEGRGEPYPTGHFGFGRRICPGRHLAEQAIWIAIATILATMTISRAIDDDGKEIIPPATATTAGITSHATPFPCTIKPRGSKADNLLEQMIYSS